MSNKADKFLRRFNRALDTSFWLLILFQIITEKYGWFAITTTVFALFQLYEIKTATVYKSHSIVIQIKEDD